MTNIVILMMVLLLVLYKNTSNKNLGFKTSCNTNFKNDFGCRIDIAYTAITACFKGAAFLKYVACYAYADLPPPPPIAITTP